LKIKSHHPSHEFGLAFKSFTNLVGIDRIQVVPTKTLHTIGVPKQIFLCTKMQPKPSTKLLHPSIPHLATLSSNLNNALGRLQLESWNLSMISSMLWRQERDYQQ
jgi:hypothetical protein